MRRALQGVSWYVICQGTSEIVTRRGLRQRQNDAWVTTKRPRHKGRGLSHESIAECNRRERRADGVWLQSERRQVIVAQRNFRGAGQEVVDESDQAGEQAGRWSVAERSGLGHLRPFGWCGTTKSTCRDVPNLCIPDATDNVFFRMAAISQLHCSKNAFRISVDISVACGIARIRRESDGLGIEWRDYGALTHPNFAARAQTKRPANDRRSSDICDLRCVNYSAACTFAGGVNAPDA